MSDFPIIGQDEVRAAEVLNQGRPCGECSLCCKLLEIPELEKPKNQWCDHFKPGVGCGIYQTRPQSCAMFACMWKMVTDIPDRLRPDKSGVVLFFTKETETNKVIQAHVDPKRPTSWNSTPHMRKLLSLVLNRGYHIALTIGPMREVLSANPLMKLAKKMEADDSRSGH